MNNAWSLLFTTALVWFTAAAASASDLRFSQLLKSEERSAAGLHRLDSDQLAVLDALVRRDTGRLSNPTTSATSGDAEPAPATFSGRLTANERRIAGLASLTEAELPKLNAFVERYQNARMARTLLGPMSIHPRSPPRPSETELKPERKIHGSFSLSYGWGKGGYSEKTGSMVLNYDDPEGRYSVTFGYTESHVKGPQVYRDPYYDPLRGGVLREQPPFRP
jgi:hypothetical protein